MSAVPDPTLGALTPTDPAKVLARAAEKLGVPVPPSDDPLARAEAEIQKLGVGLFHALRERDERTSPQLQAIQAESARLLEEVNMWRDHCNDVAHAYGPLSQLSRRPEGAEIFACPLMRGTVPPSDEARVLRVACAIDNVYSCRECGAYCADGLPPPDCRGRCSLDTPTSEHRAMAAIAAYESP